MPSKKTRKRIEHRQKFLVQQPSKPMMILPGMVVSFMYSGTSKFDKRPLILFLWLDKKTSDKVLIHGINLNYLRDQQIELLFQQLQKRTTVQLEEESKFLNEKYLRVGIRGKRVPKGIPAKLLYKTIIQPRFMKKFDIYRTYDIKKIKGLRVINYDLKFLKVQQEKEEEMKKNEEERSKETEKRTEEKPKQEAFPDKKRDINATAEKDGGEK